jgi:hypothetical protein
MKLNEFYTANDVVDAVYLSRFVYKNKDKIVEKFDDLELYSFHDIKDTEFACYKQEGTNHFFIAFRGKKTISEETALERLIEIHGDKYDYSLFKYTGVENKIKVICKMYFY